MQQSSAVKLIVSGVMLDISIHLNMRDAYHHSFFAFPQEDMPISPQKIASLSIWSSGIVSEDMGGGGQNILARVQKNTVFLVLSALRISTT